MHDKLLNCTFEIGPTSFYQTNPEQTEVLYRLALKVFSAYARKATTSLSSGNSTASRRDDADSSSGSSNCHTSRDRADSLAAALSGFLMRIAAGTIGIWLKGSRLAEFR